jgi:hypothetical protein
VKHHSVLKMAAVASSVLLTSGFVSYHAGAFKGLSETRSAPADAGSKPPPEEKVLDLTLKDITTPTGERFKFTGTFRTLSPLDTKDMPAIMSGSKAKFTPVISIDYKWNNSPSAKPPTGESK